MGGGGRCRLVLAARGDGRAEGEEIGIRVFVGQRSASISSSDLTPSALREAAERAVATLEAYRNGVGPLVKIGLVNGSMLGSFILLYAVLTLCKRWNLFFLPFSPVSPL